MSSLLTWSLKLTELTCERTTSGCRPETDLATGGGEHLEICTFVVSAL